MWQEGALARVYVEAIGEMAALILLVTVIAAWAVGLGGGPIR